MEAHKIIELVLTKVATYHETDWRAIIVHRANNSSMFEPRASRMKKMCMLILCYSIDRELIAEVFNVSEGTVSNYIEQARRLYNSSQSFSGIVRNVRADINKSHYYLDAA